MIDTKSLAEKLKAHLESEEGMASAKKYFERINQQEAIEDIQLQRFHEKYGSRLDQVIEHIMVKYESDVYYNREVFKLGYEPRTPLCFFLYKYAVKYCKKTMAQKYMSGFNHVAYYIGKKYVIRILHGQGSHAQIIKR